jgi:branched-chain amino acid transport system permease protein
VFWVLQAFLSNVLPALVSSGILPMVTSQEAATLRFVLVGLGLVLLVIFRPQGVLGDKRELTFVK